MKIKTFILSTILTFAMLISTANANTQSNVKIVVDGNTIVFEDQGPVIVNDNTLVPIRAVMEALGKTVDWNGDLNQAIVYDEYITVKLTLNSNVMTNEIKDIGTGELYTFDTELETAPMLIGDRTCLPIRAVVEAFGIAVTWDEATQSVLILSDSLLC